MRSTEPWRISRQPSWPVAALAATGIGGLAAWLMWPSASEPGADPNEAQQVALGDAVYQNHCASCHGSDLEGQPDWQTRKPDGRMPTPPHDASGHTWHHADDQLFEIVKFGVGRFAPEGYESDMPAFEGVLTDEEIRAVLAFIKSTWPERERAFQERVSQIAQEAKP